jgi:hypothetical protein
LGLVFKKDVWTWIGVALNVVNLTKDYCNNIILMVKKKLDDSKLLSKFKKHSQFKRYGILKL